MAKIKEVTAKVIALNHRKRKDDSVPLYLRVIYNRTKKVYSLKMTTDKKNFNNDTGRFIKNKEGNIELTAIQSKAEKLIKELQDAGNFSFYQFEEKFFNSHSNQTVFNYIENIIKDLETENRIGTARTYKNVLSELLRFKKSRSLQFEDITVNFLQQFERHMKRKGMKQTSIGIYFRALRTAYNKAINQKVVNAELYPFKEFKIKSGSSQKIALTKEEILKIFHYPAEVGTSLKDNVNFFVLSYFLRGMNFTDMCKLRWDHNFVDDRIVYERQKTERNNHNPKPISIEVKDHIASILNQYIGISPYILPILEPGLDPLTERYRIHGRLKRINEDIRFVAKELGIPNTDKLTFYTARHTYATVLKFSGVSVEQISESLGHSSINTTKAYLRSFGDEVLDKNDDLLI